MPLPHLIVKVEPHQLQLLPLSAQLAGAQVHPTEAEVPEFAAWLDVDQVKL